MARLRKVSGSIHNPKRPMLGLRSLQVTGHLGRGDEGTRSLTSQSSNLVGLWTRRPWRIHNPMLADGVFCLLENHVADDRPLPKFHTGSGRNLSLKRSIVPTVPTIHTITSNLGSRPDLCIRASLSRTTMEKTDAVVAKQVIQTEA